MKRLAVLFLMMLPMFALAQSKRAVRQANELTNSWNYDMELAQYNGAQGSDMIKVWSIAPDVRTAVAQAGKNAVHGVIFKGAASGGGKSLSALDRGKNGEVEHADFFDTFFSEGGKYMQFVSLVNNGNINAGDLIKLDKKRYKVGVCVVVRTADLRKYLEQEGIIKGLASGF